MMPIWPPPLPFGGTRSRLKRLGLLAALLLVVGGTGCRGGPSAVATATPSPSPWPTPRPYHSPTPTRPAPTVTFPAVSPQAPTPTPIVHIVQRGDTLSGIALRYGVSVDALQKANPRLNPRALPVGAQVLVPQAGQALGLLATPTPYPAQLRGPWCFATAEGSVCTLAVVNPGAAPLVGVRVVLEVLDPTWPEGEVWRTVTQPWLMFVPPEDELPLAVALPRALSPRAAVRAALVAALPSDDAPLPVTRIDEVHLSIEDRGSWLLTRVRLYPAGSPEANRMQRVGVLVAAYDAQKRVVALRYAEGEAAAWAAAAQVVPLYPLVPAAQVTDLRAWAEGYR